MSETNTKRQTANIKEQRHPFDLEDRTLIFAKSVLKLVKKLPANIINRELVRQLVRSAGSVGANYREANDPLGPKDFQHRIRITLREAKESVYWLELILEENVHFASEICELHLEADEPRKIFSSIARRAYGV